MEDKKRPQKKGCFGQCFQRIGNFIRRLNIGRKKNRISPSNTKTTSSNVTDSPNSPSPKPGTSNVINEYSLRHPTPTPTPGPSNETSEDGLEEFTEEFVQQEMEKISSMFLVQDADAEKETTGSSDNN